MSSTTKALYPGSFDPFTCGHLDIAKRAKTLFPEVELLVCENPTKQTMFSFEQRLKLVEEALNGTGITVSGYSGFLTDGLGRHKDCVLVRGIRGSEDILSEFSMAYYNHELGQGLETVFLPTSSKFRFVSASAARELIRHSEKSTYPKTLKNVLPEEVIKKLTTDV